MPLNHDDSAIARWEDPPPGSGPSKRIDLQPIVDTLRRRPRAWACVFEEVSTGRVAALKKASPQIEAVGRNTRKVDGKDRVDVYARYIPKPVEAAS